MYKVFKYSLCFAFVLSWVCQGIGWSQNPPVRVETEISVGWIEWLSDTFHRVMYVILMTGIITCAIYNFVKSKLENKAPNSWPKSGMDIQSFTNVLSFTEASVSGTNVGETAAEPEFGESENMLKQRLRDTQEEIEKLKKQLTTTMDDKAELESTLALLDKEKLSFEMDLEMTRVEERVELEKIRNENAFIRREIQKILEEKETAEREAERLERDIEICRTATLDAQYLKDRVDSAKQEADVLRKYFSNLEKEKGIKDLPPELSSICESSESSQDEHFANNFAWSDPDLPREYCVITSN